MDLILDPSFHSIKSNIQNLDFVILWPSSAPYQHNILLLPSSAQQKKDQEIEMLKEKMDRLGDMVMELDPGVIFYRHESGGWYTCKYPHPLTDEDRKRLTLTDEDRKRLTIPPSES